MFDEKGNLIPNYPDPQILDTGSFQSAPISVSTLTQDQKPLNVIPPVVVPPPVISKPEPVITPESPKPPSAGESFNQRLESLTAQLTGRAGITGERIGTATESFDRQLKEINDQLRKNQVEALAAQEKALESGETLGFAAGEAARVQRNFAIEDMRLNIRAQAMQGNIDLAAKTAQRAVDAEFAQTEKDIEIARQNIIKNYDTFTPAEKKRADATLQRLDKDDAFVKEKKEVRKRISDLIIKLAETGQVPNTVFSQLEKLDSYDEAVKIAAPFLKEKIQTTITEIGGRKVLINNQTGETIKDLGKSDETLSTQVVEIEGRKLLIDSKTGQTIKDLGGAISITPETQKALEGEYGDIITSASNLVG